MKASFRSIALPKFPLADLRQLLRKELGGIAADAKAALQSHIDSFSGNEMQTWILNGTQYEIESGDICPYCGQSLLGSDLIQHYQVIFDKTFQKFEADVSTFASRHLSLSKRISDIRNAIETNRVRVTFWAEHISKISIPELDADLVVCSMTQTEAEIIALLTTKQSALFKSVEFSPELEAAYDRWHEVAESLQEYKSVVHDYNESIDALRAESESGDLAQEKQKLLELRYTRLRFRADVANCCQLHDTQSQKAKNLNDDLHKLQEANSKAIKQTFDEYGACLNKYLHEFGAGFKVVELKQTRIGGQMRVDYKISLSDTKIALGNEKTEVSERSFRNVLSEGDKRYTCFGLLSIQIRSHARSAKQSSCLR